MLKIRVYQLQGVSIQEVWKSGGAEKTLFIKNWEVMFKSFFHSYKLQLIFHKFQQVLVATISLITTNGVSLKIVKNDRSSKFRKNLHAKKYET